MIPYIHKKTGKRYRLLAFGTDRTNSRDGTAVAIYCPDESPWSVCVRDIAEFREKFDENIGTDNAALV